MILIVSACREALSEREFVWPLLEIARKTGKPVQTKSYLKVSGREAGKAERIIISGTALKDFGYLECMPAFSWLEQADRPVLGICAGMQAIAGIFGEVLEKKVMVGQHDVKVLEENPLAKGSFKSYFLSTLGVPRPRGFRVLAEADGSPCMIKHAKKDQYGCLFHPEVMNREIIERFCRI